MVAGELGWQGIVIYKTGFADLALDGDYTFIVGEEVIVPREPKPVDDLTIIPVDLDPSDDYYVFDYVFSDVVEDIYGDPLVVDHYNFYWAWEPYDTFPGDWFYLASNTASEFLGVPCYIVMDNSLYVLVTAVDEDGVMSVIIDDKISIHHESELNGIAQPMGVLPLQKQIPETGNLPVDN